jgi:hypothetical protein
MNQDDIIRMAREAGAKDYGTGEEDVTALMLKDDAIERFAALVAAAEREKVAEEIFDMCKEGWWDSEGMRHHWSKRGQA